MNKDELIEALRLALEACVEDSCELLGERGWWKDEPRCGYSQRYEETAENIATAHRVLELAAQTKKLESGEELP